MRNKQKTRNLFPKPIWKGMMRIVTYMVTDPMYVQIAIHISKCALQEQILRERRHYNGRCLLAKRSGHVSFTLLFVLDLTYMMTTLFQSNLRMILLWSSQTHFNLSCCLLTFLQQLLTLYHNLWMHERMTFSFILDPVT